MCVCVQCMWGGGEGGMVRSVRFTPDSYIYLLLHGSCIFYLFYYKILCNVSIVFLKLISLSLSHWVFCSPFSFFRHPMYFMPSYLWFPAPTWCYFSSTFHVLLFPSTPCFLFLVLLSNPHDTGSNHMPLYFQCY